MIEKEIIRMINEVFTESFEISADKLAPEANIFNDLGLNVWGKCMFSPLEVKT